MLFRTRKYKNVKLFQWIYLQFFLCNCELQMEICNAAAVVGKWWRVTICCVAAVCIGANLEDRHIVPCSILYGCCWCCGALSSSHKLMLGRLREKFKNLARNHTSYVSMHQTRKDKCECIQPKRQNQLQTIHVITTTEHQNLHHHHHHTVRRMVCVCIYICIHCLWTNKYLWAACNFGFMFNYKSSGFKAWSVCLRFAKLW